MGAFFSKLPVRQCIVAEATGACILERIIKRKSGEQQENSDYLKITDSWMAGMRKLLRQRTPPPPLRGGGGKG